MESKKEITEEAAKEIGNVSIQHSVSTYMFITISFRKRKKSNCGCKREKGKQLFKTGVFGRSFFKNENLNLEFSTEIRLFLSTIY